MLTGGSTGCHLKPGHRFADQETGALVEADHRIVRIKRQPVEIKNLLQASDQGGIQLRDAPGLFQVRLEFVFLESCAPWCAISSRNRRVRSLDRPAGAASSGRDRREALNKPGR